jgi:APA family basic amino acid/polyamine antiporter
MSTVNRKPSTDSLRPFDLTLLVISLVIGMGIFRTPVTVAAKAGDPFIFYAAWVIGGVIALCGALTFAEIGRHMPATGAYYRIFSVAYHPVVAFVINVIILISNAASGAGIALIGAEYLQPILPQVPLAITAAVFIAMFYALNLLGLRASARWQNVLIGIKVALLLCIIAAIVLVPSASHTALTGSLTAHSAPLTAHGSPLTALGIALIAVSFTYGGYQSTINFGGDVRDGRMLSRAIIRGVIIITAIYLLANMAYVHVIGFDALAHSSSIAAIMADRLFGEAVGSILSAVLVVSVLGYINVIPLSNPRVMIAMSGEGTLPRFIARSRSTRNVNVVALTLFTAASIASILVARTFDTILTYTIFLDCIGMASAAATVFVLRRRAGEPTFRHAWIPGLFMVAYAFIAWSIFVDDPPAAINGLLLFSACALIGWIAWRRSRSATPGFPPSRE